MTIEDTLASIDTTLKSILLIAQSATSGAAAVATPPGRKASVGLLDGDAEGTRYWHLVEAKAVAKSAPGEDGPLGGLELNGKDYTKHEAKYAKNVSTSGPSTQAGQAATQTGATTTPAATNAASTSGSADSVSFETLTAEITAMSKKEGGREKVKSLFTKWGVAKFPEVQAKGDFAAKMADVKALNEPAEDDLGLG